MKNELCIYIYIKRYTIQINSAPLSCVAHTCTSRHRNHLLSTVNSYIDYMKRVPLKNATLPMIIEYLDRARDALQTGEAATHPLFTLAQRLKFTLR